MKTWPSFVSVVFFFVGPAARNKNKALNTSICCFVVVIVVVIAVSYLVG